MEEKLDMSSTEIIVIGGSSGSLDVVLKIISSVKKDIAVALVIVLHRKTTTDSALSELLAIRSVAPVKEVEDKDPVLAGNIYLAPSDYHLLFEKKHIFSLDDSEKINYSRPSIDVTFESAAEAYGATVSAILLSGSNADGTEGLLAIHAQGGVTIVQDPETAGFPYMPQQAILNAPVDYQMNVSEMIEYINNK
ncbi:MAG: chemotaxis protein CheB [Cytophagaceae bacterium]|jgi:two-component system chemotaxis response regulator CheB|nr:chemotaxis protein CheB [Cytophagaceae bacterium]